MRRGGLGFAPLSGRRTDRRARDRRLRRRIIMRNFLTRLRYRTHWRIYSRVLPVVAVGLFVVAFLSWQGYRQWSQATVQAAQARGLAGIAETVRARATFAALDLELQRQAPAAGEASLADPVVAGLVTEGDAVLCDSLDTASNRETLAVWRSEHLRDRNCTSGTAPERSACVTILPGAGGRVVLHRPVTLEIGPPWESYGGSRRAAVLPVAVGAVAYGAASRDSSVVLLDLSRLIATDIDCADWWCLVGPGGEVLLSAGGTLATGASLAGEQPALQEEAARPARLLQGMLASARPTDQLAERTGLAPWTVSRHRGARVPFEVVLGTRTDLLERSRQRTLSLVALLALLALLAGLTGITRVVGDVSRRLAALGAHMGHLRDGEYSRRLPVRTSDEVGRLEEHYNGLAARLADTHTRLTEQAARLETALADMRRLDKAKDDFLVLVSHEVRTPLTCIIGGVDYLRTVLKGAAPDLQQVLARLELDEVVEVIANSGDRLNGFLNDALRMTSIRAGNRRLDLQAHSAAELVGSSLARVAAAAAVRGIRVEDELSATRAWRFLGDGDTLRIVFDKLLDNAVVHNRDAGRVLVRETAQVPSEAYGAPSSAEDRSRLTERPSFAPWAETDLLWRTVEIRNTGPAIPADRYPALFGRFEIVGEIENHSRGAGLGLSIARALVEEHGGRLAVLSGEEHGTSFYVQLPAVTADARPARTFLWDEGPERIGGRTGNEEVGVVADAAGLDVELDDPGAAPDGKAHQPGGGVDGAGRADHEEEVTAGDRAL